MASCWEISIKVGLRKLIKSAIDGGMIELTTTVFDYGCGHGQDIALLSASGITCNGWDPVFCPDGPQQAADVVFRAIPPGEPVVRSSERRTNDTGSFAAADCYSGGNASSHAERSRTSAVARSRVGLA
jgi:hypothetical protein